MVPVRPTFWNIPTPSEIAQYILGLGVAIFLVWAVLRHIQCWRKGASEPLPPLGRQVWRESIRRLVRFVLVPERLREDLYGFVTHLAIFWGMVFLALGTIIATVDWDLFHLVLGGRLLSGLSYKLFELVLDLAGVALLVGLLLAIIRRYFWRPARLSVPRLPRDKWQSAVILGLLLTVAVTGFIVEGLRIRAGVVLSETAAPATADTGDLAEADQAVTVAATVRAWSPVGAVTSEAFRGLPLGTVRRLHLVIWWIHAIAAFGFLLLIPFTKANHLIAGLAHVIIPRQDGLPSAVSGDGEATPLRALTWRQRLEVSACTSCGKCQEACPAHLANNPLTPKGLVWGLHGLFMQDVWLGWKTLADSQNEQLWLSDEALWSCYSCRACEEKCPLAIRHTGLVVALRRRLVDRGALADGLQEVLVNLQRYGNSLGQSPRKRGDWTRALPFSVKNAAREPVEYLWFVGDYASYDPRAQQVSQTVARILHLANLDFGILYEKEKNAGNDVRRVGEEGLFEWLREENLKLLKGRPWRWLITSDPHSFHALRHEYGLGGCETSSKGAAARGERAEEVGSTLVTVGATENPSGTSVTDPVDRNGDDNGLRVRHTAELFWDLLSTGRLKVVRKLGRRVTYHDPCYLGRYNNVFEPPRAVLKAIGCDLVEMPRHGPESFCCGAGGGRIWMKDRPGSGERPAEMRVREALQLEGVSELVVACPKDLVMFQDAIKAVRAEERIRVVDLADLVWESVTPTPDNPATGYG